jgi:hypothetical protein
MGRAWVASASVNHSHYSTERRDMSKKMLSTALLFLIGAGFGVFSLFTLITAKDTDTVFVGLLYLVPAVAAFVALIMLPFKSVQERDER